MKYYQDPIITGSTMFEGPVNILGTLEATSSLAISSSYALEATSASYTLSSSYSSTATSASYATTAQPVDNLTYNRVTKTTTQSIPSGVATNITNWTSHITNINSTGWNGAAGTYTAPKAGIFRVSGVVQIAANQVAINSEFALLLNKNAQIVAQARWFSPVVGNPIFPSSIDASAVITLDVGDVVSMQVYQALGGNRGLHTSGNYFEIQQIANL